MAETIEDVLQRYQELFGGGQSQGMGPQAPAPTPQPPGFGLMQLLRRRNADGPARASSTPPLGGPIGPESPSQDFTGGFAQTPEQIPQEELSSVNMGRYDTMKPKIIPQGPDMVPLGNRYVPRELSSQEKDTADWWHGVQGPPDTPESMGYGAPQPPAAPMNPMLAGPTAPAPMPPQTLPHNAFELPGEGLDPATLEGLFQVPAPEIPGLRSKMELSDAYGGQVAKDFGGFDKAEEGGLKSSTPTVVGEKSAEDLDRERNRLMALRGIAHGLNDWSTGMIKASRLSAGHPVGDLESPGTPQLDEALYRNEQTLRPGERQLLEQAFPGVKLPPGITMDRIKTLGPMYEKLILQQRSDEARMARNTATNASREKVGGMRAEATAKNAQAGRDLSDSHFRAREVDRTTEKKINELNDIDLALNQVETALSTNSSVADSLSRFQLARAAGNRGQVTDKDVAAVGRLGVLGLLDKMSQTATGRFTPEQRKQMLGLVRAWRESTGKLRQGALSNRAQTITHPEMLKDEGQVRRLLGVQDSAVTLVEPDGTEHEVAADKVDEAMRRAQAAGTTLQRKP